MQYNWNNFNQVLEEVIRNPTISSLHLDFVTQQISVDSCPVNCIHWVDTEELEVLEYLIQPQPKVGYGIYGQGWERPANVFMAAKSFNKQLKQQEENQQRCSNYTLACLI